MNRAEFQALAEERARDAEVLLAVGQWSGAYYLAGYAVECALKACIAKLTNEHDYPDKDFANKCYTHRIETLVKLANLELQRKVDGAANAVLSRHWTLVTAWDEGARYQIWAEPHARKLVAAVIDPADGVLPWIKAHW